MNTVQTNQSSDTGNPGGDFTEASRVGNSTAVKREEDTFTHQSSTPPAPTTKSVGPVEPPTQQVHLDSPLTNNTSSTDKQVKDLFPKNAPTASDDITATNPAEVDNNREKQTEAKDKTNIMSKEPPSKDQTSTAGIDKSSLSEPRDAEKILMNIGLGVSNKTGPTASNYMGKRGTAGVFLSSSGGGSQTNLHSDGRIIRRRRRWTSQELTLFELGLSTYDRDYDKIASLIKTRSTRQVRRHANYHLHKKRQQDVRHPGSQDDDSMVVDSDEEDRQRAGEFGHYDEALHELDLMDHVPRWSDQHNSDQRKTEGGSVRDPASRTRTMLRAPHTGLDPLTNTEESKKSPHCDKPNGESYVGGYGSPGRPSVGNEGISSVSAGSQHQRVDHAVNRNRSPPPFMETMEIDCGQNEYVQRLISKNWKMEMVGGVILLSPPPY